MKIGKKIGWYGRRFLAGILCMISVLTLCVNAEAADEESNAELTGLYAESAVLLDAESGRVLYGKNETDQKPMASTTKIMTCILALEYGDLASIVTVSDEASGQPKVHLGMRTGEQFYLKDLLYSLMLESHNDSAVAIAEHIGASVSEFADLMNNKAAELGLADTYFITPNGLDGEDENGIHSTTAADLARLMKYCVMDSPSKSEFIGITGKDAYQFMDVTDTRVFSCTNHNAFLTMMDGAFSGKTGFTSKAGYCYVGALRKDGKTLIVSVLACGWPNNKSYKWSDTRALMEYGLEHYESVTAWEDMDIGPLPVNDGIPVSENLFEEAAAEVIVSATPEEQEQTLLLHDEEEIAVKTEFMDELDAPVKAGTQVGSVTYSIGDEIIADYPIVVKADVERKTYTWCLGNIVKLWLGNRIY